MGTNYKWQVSELIHSGKVDQEIILMSIEAGFYFGLNEPGSRVWDLIKESPKTLDEITSSLVEEFDVDKAQCEKDVLSFLSELENKGLILKILA